MHIRTNLIRLIGAGLIAGLLVGCGGDKMMDDGHMDDDSMSRTPTTQQSTPTARA